MKLTEHYLRQKYARMIKCASLAEAIGLIEVANRFLLAASHLSYSFCLQYKDEVADSLVTRISDRIKRRKDLLPTDSKNKCVFFDAAAVFNGGLTNQYMEAIREAGWEVLYLTSQNMESPTRQDLKELILKNKKARIVTVPQNYRGVKRLQFMYDTIVSYGSNNVFIHIPPFSPTFIEVCAALPESINRFLINYTDSSFILGIGNADYILEMSLPGSSISRIWRHVPENRQLFLPFYPYFNEHSYQGLPACCEGKKIILSGGNYWKVMDKDETYFKICKGILDENLDAVIVYPGMGNEKPLRDLLEKYEMTDRFVLLGWRKDIAELFEHCDVHLATYPLFGGLMVLYAALKKKPILNYSPEGRLYGPEQIVCQLDSWKFSKDSIDAVVRESKHLLSDEAYRKEEGEKLYNCCVTREWFNEHFVETIKTKNNCGPAIVIDESIDLSVTKTNDCITYHSESGIWKKRLFSYLGPLCLFVAPELTSDYVKYLFKKL